MKTLTVLALALTLTGCTNESKARETLEDMGFKNINMTGHSWTGCGHDDDTCDGFEATSPGGRRVEGIVGCGWGAFSKGCTVRIR